MGLFSDVGAGYFDSDEGYEPFGDEEPDDFRWTCADGRRLKITEMETSHVQNILRANKSGRLALDRGAKRYFQDELQRRGEAPIRDFTCESEGLAHAALSELYVHWPKVPADRRDVAVSVVRCFLHTHAQPDPTADDPSFQAPVEKTTYAALAAYFVHGKQVADEIAQRELANAFMRWARRMGIEEALQG
jgi:hypothetical protein